MLLGTADDVIYSHGGNGVDTFSWLSGDNSSASDRAVDQVQNF